VAPFLAAHGFPALDDSRWLPGPGGDAPAPLRPKLAVTVRGHEEAKGHTWYLLDCSLQGMSSEALNWQVSKRLEQLRDDLHDRLKTDMGQGYAERFASAPFAHKGGLPGTTARLQSWFEVLVTFVNGEAACSPSLVAVLLGFLDAPELEASNAFEALPELRICEATPTKGGVGFNASRLSPASGRSSPSSAVAGRLASAAAAAVPDASSRGAGRVQRAGSSGSVR